LAIAVAAASALMLVGAAGAAADEYPFKILPRDRAAATLAVLALADIARRMRGPRALASGARGVERWERIKSAA
jgi:hypothetical protein